NARRIVFAGLLTAGADLAVDEGRLVIRREGKVRKLTTALDQITFSGRRAASRGQRATYVTERCVLELRPDGLAVTEIAPGVELERDVLAQAEFPLLVPQPPRRMAAALFRAGPIGLHLQGTPA
ncbi:MAG TPA: acyl CoA:acetate/3-ketoacid CoA transferase, partial [Acetobacteraceae bacterium]|nr:acyl CoA:acetate/3-ketoacid CoA transferase [Acetobacteraceae bacterium]